MNVLIQSVSERPGLEKYWQIWCDINIFSHKIHFFTKLIATVLTNRHWETIFYEIILHEWIG